MKLNRHKRFRRILRFYKVHYQLEAPFALITDAEFIHAALKGKIHIKEQIPKILQDKCFPRVTGCTIHALKHKGDEYSGARLIAKRFDRIQCGHNTAIREEDCIAGVLKSKVLGTGACAGVQALDIRARIRFQMHFVPIFYIMGQVPILEQPASMAKGSAKELEVLSLQPSQWEKEALGIAESSGTDQMMRKKRKRKEPNPLSCKKKKRKGNPTVEVPMTEKVRKRRRKRSKHQGDPQSETAVA